jgi:two-component system, OmpR family, sensor histidine kinase ChvG
MRRPRVSLRLKLALVALLLLALPWAGYEYVREMERFLLDGQEQALLATARAIATALHDRPGLMAPRAEREADPRARAEEELKRIAARRGDAETPPAPQAPGGAPAPEGAPPGAVPPAPRPSAIIARESSPRDEPEDIAEILRGVQHTTSRVWVVSRDLRVLALAGSLRRPDAEPDDGWAHRVLGELFPRPTENFDDAIGYDALANGREIAAALRGVPDVGMRGTPDAKAVVITAAHPIWSGDDVAGAVVAEETTNSILSARSRALERLLVVTLVVFAAAAGVLAWLATGISSRIRRLRDEAETAIDARGRLAHIVTAQKSRDEIGDLSRSFSALLGKLGQYNTYLESMASRMSHELRTPIAVVRSSLENLKLSPTAEESRVYIGRAEEGLRRLGTILTRMSEATRLEQSLSSLERERFDLAAVVRGSVDGYRLAYPERSFELHLPGEPVPVSGSPDLAAQLLDKLVANAADFCAPGAPIRVRLDAAAGAAQLRVENSGPPLPETMRAKLFESMVSVRAERGGDKPGSEPHLGLGLYIARVIAEFHGGAMRAENLAGGDGVAVTASFRLAPDSKP